jgi:hypothetical protein
MGRSAEAFRRLEQVLNVLLLGNKVRRALLLSSLFLCFSFIPHIAFVLFLTSPQRILLEKDTRTEICPDLTLNQLRHLLSMYTPAVDIGTVHHPV